MRVRLKPIINEVSASVLHLAQLPPDFLICPLFPFNFIFHQNLCTKRPTRGLAKNYAF